jgi:hypothetical protein
MQAPYSIRPRTTKLYVDLKWQLWWNNTKGNVSYGREWKLNTIVWQDYHNHYQYRSEIVMDFITGLPMSRKCKSMIWVTVDQSTENGHSVAVQHIDTCEKLTWIYSKECEVPLLPQCLEAVANIVGIATELQYCLSFSKMRRNERTKRSLRGHIESVCIRILRVVRWALAIRRSYNNSYQTTIMMGTIWCNIWERV